MPEIYEYMIDLSKVPSVSNECDEFHFVSDNPNLTKQNIADSMTVNPRFAHDIVISNDDVYEEFTLVTDRHLTKEEIVDSMVVLKRKRPQSQTRINDVFNNDNDALQSLKTMFGFK